MLNILEEGAPEYRTDNPALSKAYQDYAAVALAISPSGGRKLLELTEEDGMFAPVDCVWFEWAKAGRLNSYSPTPLYCDLVIIDWGAPSTIRGNDNPDEWGSWF
jgi:GR25 family glycosyltransferase involved in LPS biosynthesis